MNRLALSVCPLLVAGSLLAPSSLTAQEPPFTDFDQRVSYAIGLNLGRELVSQGVEIDLDIVVQGLRDALAGQAQISDEDIRQTMQELGSRLETRAQAKGQERHAEAQAFFSDNGSRDGVSVTASGLQYEVVRTGEGPKPSPSDQVRVNYRGTFLDGSVFDSSYDRGQPATFRVDQVIPGWSEALQLMPVGSHWRLYIPPELAYGEAGAGGVIPPFAALIFDVELLAIEP